MKNYIWNGKQYQFDETKAPADAVPVETVKAPAVEEKKLDPKNKARETKKK